VINLTTACSIITIIGTIVTIIVTLPKGYNWLYKWVMTPTIKWGFWDCPTSSSTHHFITIKMKNPKPTKITIKLKPLLGNPANYTVQVTKFYQYSGREGIDQIKTEQTDCKDHKTIEFEVDDNYTYRIITQANIGRSNILPVNNFKLFIESPEANITHKQINIKLD